MNLYSTFARPLLFQLSPELAHHLTLASLRIPVLSKLLTLGRKAPNDPVKLLNLPFGTVSELPLVSIKMLRRCWHGAILGLALLNSAQSRFIPNQETQNPVSFGIHPSRLLSTALAFRIWELHPSLQGFAVFAIAMPFRISYRHQSGQIENHPLDQAPIDYLESLKLLQPLGDYFVINISSPNTPGLRDLAKPDDLSAFFRRFRILTALAPRPNPSC